MIDKETFCEVIEKLRQQIYIDRKFGEVVSEMFGSGSKCSYNDNLLIESIMSLLQVHFPKAEDGFCRIEHHCFFIEFGRIDNKELMPAEDLYEVLIADLV
jgi:hypothetical protein